MRTLDLGVRIVFGFRLKKKGQTKVLIGKNSGNYIAKGNGVHRELESERSRRQTSLCVVLINIKHTNGVILAKAVGV